MQRNKTPFIELANKQLFPVVDSIVQTTSSDAVERDYIEAVKQAFLLIRSGESAELLATIREKEDRAKIEGILNVSALEFQYHYSIQIDNKYFADLRVPNVDRVPAYARAYAIRLADGGLKNIPDFITPMGQHFKTGCRLYYKGQWTVIHGFGCDRGFLLSNQQREQQAYIKNYPRAKVEVVDYTNVKYTILSTDL